MGEREWEREREREREREDNGLFITLVPKVLYLQFLIRWPNNIEEFKWNLIGWLIKLSVKIFLPLMVINRRGNFVFENWGCTSIYWPVSYPLRSLTISGHNTKTSKLYFFWRVVKMRPFEGQRGGNWGSNVLSKFVWGGYIIVICSCTSYKQKKSFTTYR